MVRHKEMVCVCSVSEEIEQQKPATKGLLPGRQARRLPSQVPAAACLRHCDFVASPSQPNDILKGGKGELWVAMETRCQEEPSEF